jgi:hypothetical protein
MRGEGGRPRSLSPSSFTSIKEVMPMTLSSRVKELRRRAKKKHLVVDKSPIDGTFMVMFETRVPLIPETIKTKPWGKRSKMHPPEVEIYEGATLRETEQFVKQYIPPWSRECDPDIAASVKRALGALAYACRNSRRGKAGKDASDASKMPDERVSAGS